MKTTSRYARIILVTALVAGIGTSTSLAVPSRNAAPSDDPPEPATPTTPTPPIKLPIKKTPAPTQGGTTTPSNAGAGPGGAISNPAAGEGHGEPANGNAASPAGRGEAVGGSAAANKDKGARDPADFFRPANTVRTLYSLDEYPTSKQEQAKYTSSTASADLLASYVKYLNGNGWTQTELHENNGGPNDVHQIYGTWSDKNGDSLDLRLIDLQPGIVEISINLKHVVAHT
jgi:hypothetical protein